jgi:hypothetical protein
VLAWVVVAATVLALVVLGIVLARQGSPGGLSEQPGTNRSRQQPNVVGRPAGPDAEPMGVDEPGDPTIRPELHDRGDHRP